MRRLRDRDGRVVAVAWDDDAPSRPLVQLQLAPPRRRPGKQERKRTVPDPFLVPPPIPPEPEPPPPEPRVPLPPREIWERHVCCVVDAILQCPLGSGASYYSRRDDGRVAPKPTLDETERAFTLTRERRMTAARRDGWRIRRALFESRQWRPHA